MSATFTARFHSDCGDCAGHVSPGDEVTFTAANDVVHVDCGPAPSSSPSDHITRDFDADDLELKRAACPSCFLELPVSGVCGDCE